MDYNKDKNIELSPLLIVNKLDSNIELKQNNNSKKL